MQMFGHLQDNLQILVYGFRHVRIFDAPGVPDEEELHIYNSSDNDEDDVDENEDSEVEKGNANENNDDVIQAISTVRSNLPMSAVSTDSDSDPSVDPIMLSS